MPLDVNAKRNSDCTDKSGKISVKDLYEELVNLQVYYVNKLKSLYEAPEDNSSALYGLYSAESFTELWLIEKKLAIVYAALACNDGWIELKKKGFLESQADKRRPILTKRLEKYKKDYFSKLVNLITVPKNFIYTDSGYYTASAEQELKSKEELIKLLDISLGTNVLQECLDEKQKTLDKYKQSFSKKIDQIVLKAVAPIGALILILFYSISYLSSKDEIELYKSTMQKAENYEEEQSYISAIAAYTQAHDEYNGFFYKDGYKEDAMLKKENASRLLFEQINMLSQEHFNKKEFIQSRRDWDSIKAYMLTPYLQEEFNNEYESLNTKLLLAVEKEKNTIIADISNNNGKLTVSGKKLLKQLLEISPEDYWLNIIQKKQK